MFELLESNPILSVVLGLAVGFVGTRLNKRIDRRQREVIGAAGKLRELGFTQVPEILEAFAVGDITDGITRSRELYVKMHDPTARRTELARVAKSIFTELVNDNETRDRTIKLVTDLLQSVQRDGITTPKLAE